MHDAMKKKEKAQSLTHLLVTVRGYFPNQYMCGLSRFDHPMYDWTYYMNFRRGDVRHGHERCSRCVAILAALDAAHGPAHQHEVLREEIDTLRLAN